MKNIVLILTLTQCHFTEVLIIVYIQIELCRPGEVIGPSRMGVNPEFLSWLPVLTTS